MGGVRLQSRGVFLPTRMDVTVWCKWKGHSNRPHLLSCAISGDCTPELDGLQDSQTSSKCYSHPNWRLGGSESHLQENSRRRRTERKAALEVSIIIAVFLLCYLPTWIVGLCLRFVKITTILSEGLLVPSCILAFSSVCNPIIYSIRKSDFRKAVKGLFLRWRITPQGKLLTSTIE